MTKILYIHGDDYAACDFDNARERGDVSASDLWAEAHAVGPREFESEREYFLYEALEFGEVDPAFIEWIYAEQDHDARKDANFYVVEWSNG